MYEIIEIKYGTGSMEIINNAIDGIITDSKELIITLLTYNGGVVSLKVDNKEDFQLIKNRWANVLKDRIKDMEQSRQEHDNGRKAQLLMQAKMTETIVNQNR